MCVLGWFAPSALAASGNDVGANVASLLKGYASELYGGIVAIVGLMFLVNRRYTELGVFLFAAIVVAWMVFAPARSRRRRKPSASRSSGEPGVCKR